MVPGVYKFHSRNVGFVIDKVSEIELFPGTITFIKGHFIWNSLWTDTRVESMHADIAIDEISEL